MDTTLDDITLRGIGRSFALTDRRLVALEAIDLYVPAGGVMAIVGPSGSAKSTLLRLIGGAPVTGHRDHRGRGSGRDRPRPTHRPGVPAAAADALAERVFDNVCY